MDLDYRVELDTYSGPLDLLLLLVRRHEIDLNDIPIAQLTDQYLRYLELIKAIDVNSAGEFLVMAATLLEIKSAMLMPASGGQEEEGQASEALDPRYELVQQLLAYKRFKDASQELDDRRLRWQAHYPLRPAQSAGAQEEAELIELDLEDVHVFDLCEAFGYILQTIGEGPAGHEVVDDDTPVALHAEDIVDRLERDGPLNLAAMFVGRSSRVEMIGLFLAMLELVRQRRVGVIQVDLHGEIHLELNEGGLDSSDDTADATDWRDPKTGEIQYEWPTEQARQRAERRAERRAARLKDRQFDQSDDDLIIVDRDDASNPDVDVNDQLKTDETPPPS